MRWVPIGLALGGVIVAIAAPVLANDEASPKPMPAPQDPLAGATNVVTTSDAKPADEAKPKPKDKAKAKAKDKVDAIKVEPNEFTNDPILGKAARVHGDETKGLVTFTFDDGPNPETTPAVLDALEKYEIPATFFVVTRRLLGKHGEKPRAILARTMEEGHLVASHSVTHAFLGNANTKLLDKELDQSFKTLATEAKRPIGLFRAPFGALGAGGRARLKKLGVTEVFWSIDTLDWQAKKADKLRAKVLKMILKQEGGVVLFHDVKPITAQIIGDVLDDLEAENCQRLQDKKDPIWPVSMHYFLRDGKKQRSVPEAEQRKTEAYKTALPARCAKRPPPPAPKPPEPAPAPKPAEPPTPKSAEPPPAKK